MADPASLSWLAFENLMSNRNQNQMSNNIVFTFRLCTYEIPLEKCSYEN